MIKYVICELRTSNYKRVMKEDNDVVRRTLLFFFLVMYSAIPFFLKTCNVFVTTSLYAFWLRPCFF